MAVVAETTGVVEALRELLPAEQVLWRDYDLMLYEYDGSIDKHRPLAVVFPLSAEQVSRVVKACDRFGVPYTARGAGTGLSGGAIPAHGGVLISLARMNRILEIDPDNMRAIVEPGVVNMRLGQATAAFGLTYVPDPSSQKACTIGGNVGENSAARTRCGTASRPTTRWDSRWSCPAVTSCNSAAMPRTAPATI